MEAFISGNEACVKGAIAAGARGMFGYPITPSTEILAGWAAAADRDPDLKFLQTEDETAAGFVLNGAVLEGLKSFTATSGPGTVLMQDPLSMAENLRIPTVTVVMQRGGPSTGQVNYSGQEVTLACYGGNGEGLRIVYSAGSPQEMYDFVIKAFNTAWRYKWPTLVLGDGYIGKQKTLVSLKNPINSISSQNLLNGKNLKNCYSSEEEFAKYLNHNISEYQKIEDKVSEASVSGNKSAKFLVVAHGSTFYNVKQAIDQLGKKNNNFQLFRPITLRPFAKQILNSNLKNKKKIIILESSHGQLARIVKDNLNQKIFSGDIVEFLKPAESFMVDDIINDLSTL